jgi:heptosyltransferase-2
MTHTLVIQTAFLGDVVLTTPLLAALAERHGPVDVVTTPAAVPLVETHPAVRRVVPYDKRGKDAGLGGLRRLARALRAEHYGAAYLPHRSLRTAALAWLAGIPLRVGFRGRWSALYTESVPKPVGPRHGVVARAWPSTLPEGQGPQPRVLHPPLGIHESRRLLALIGASPHDPAVRLYPTEHDESTVLSLLQEEGIGGDFVAVAPGSIWATKRWPYYEELARRLGRRLPVVVVGGPEDAPLAQALVAAVQHEGGRALSACGRLTLRESAWLIGLARLLVTNDSAPLHLAAAMGTRTVAVFGPTVPEFGFGPLRPDDVVVGIGGLGCRPCSSHGQARCPLGHHHCMTQLAADFVDAAIAETGALRRRD